MPVIAALLSAFLSLVQGPIAPGGSSPRIAALSAAVAKETAGAEAAFWTTLAREHAPIVEPVPGDPSRVLVTIVWHGDGATRSVESMGGPLQRIAKTDVWYTTFSMPRDHRAWYGFTVTKTSGQEAVPDPLNPHRFRPPVQQEWPQSVRDAGQPMMNKSIIVLPDAPASPWVDPRPNVAAGTVEEKSYASRILGGPRRVWLYTPPRSSQPIAGVLVCLWGPDFLNAIPVPTILDNLIGEGKAPRLAAVFVDQGTDRYQNFDSLTRFASSFAGELIPWIRANVAAPADPKRTIVAGYSASGLASAFIALEHPSAVGNVLSQSGAYWRAFEGSGGSEPEWIMNRVRQLPKQPIRFFLDVGGAELVRPGPNGVTFVDANRHLRDAVTAKGYEVEYREVAGGEHEFVHWRTTFADGILYLTRDWVSTARSVSGRPARGRDRPATRGQQGGS